MKNHPLISIHIVMAPSILKKRKLDDTSKSRPSNKIRKQQHYSSPSSSSADEAEHEFPAVNLADSDSGAEVNAKLDTSSTHSPTPEIQPSDAQTSPSASDSESDSGSSTSQPDNPNHTKLSKQKSKRNDPAAFASSISAILGSKLTTLKRSDPVLARSTTAAEANASIANARLEKKARQKLRGDKKEALEKGRVKDVLLGTDAGLQHGEVGAMIEEENRLRKTAQRGVVKLFTAGRQAQVRGEEARKEAKSGSRGRKEERVGEMSKKGFLEMVAGGGGGDGKGEIEEG